MIFNREKEAIIRCLQKSETLESFEAKEITLFFMKLFKNGDTCGHLYEIKFSHTQSLRKFVDHILGLIKAYSAQRQYEI